MSLSKQFIIYCDNPNARGDISSFAENTKQRLLALLGERDRWKYPIVINIARPDPAHPARVASNVALYEVDGGFKVELDVSLAAKDPADVRFQQQIVRALLLEFAYRDQPALVKGGTPYAEPPTWLIEGAAELLQSRDSGPNAAVFKRLISNNRVPALGDFLTLNTGSGLDSTTRKVYAQCAMGLVQLLVDLPDGRRSLGALVKHWPRANGNSFGELIKNFPVLGTDTPSIEKWWTLSLAHLSAADRFEGLLLDETEQRLAPLLSFEIPVNKAGEKQMFSLEQFEQFRKIPASRDALTSMSANLIALGTQASAMSRPVVYEYQKIAADLARGKTRGIKERLSALAQYRDKLLQHMEEITDYINWFEATQITKTSGSFDGYIRAANTPEQRPRREDALTHYVDEIEQQLGE